MAASIYATPPPDLSSEDTALSDVSNTSSSLNQRNGSSSTSSNNHTNNNANKNNNNITTTTTSNSTNTNTQQTIPITSNRDEATSTTSATNESTAVVAAAASTNKKEKRSIADVLLDSPSQEQQQQQQQQQQAEDQTNSLDMRNPTSDLADMTAAAVEATANVLASQNASAAIAAVAAAANAAMQLQLLEAINDAAKKRRKQNNPSRLGALNLGEALPSETATTTTDASSDIALKTEVCSDNDDEQNTHAPAIPIDYEEKLSKMFLPKSMEQLKETFELLQQQQQQLQLGNISPMVQAMSDSKSNSLHCNEKMSLDNVSSIACAPQLLENTNISLENPYQTYCKECGENFENEFKLGLHMLQEHNVGDAASNNADNFQQKSELTHFDILESVKVKLERPDYDSPTSPATSNAAANSQNEHVTPTHALSNGGKEPWLNAVPSMGFPFPPEAAAAAALTASGYLPLLGVPGFPGVDGINRPPLRIFNPEAFCDLCNKEFCNKYFLKTHKANKHGIYDPAIASGVGDSNAANVNAMNQMFHMQMQQQQQQQQQQHLQQQLQQKQQQQQSLDLQQQAQSLAEPQIKPASAATTATAAGSTAATTAQTPINIPGAPPPVYCGICSKRFTNVFAMRRHRAKTHEQQQSTTPTQRSSSSPNETVAATTQSPQQTSKSDVQSTANQDAKTDSSGNNNSNAALKQFQMPDDFRQDFTLEQEEVSFTPQPRKLSPQSQQQAREANFAHDKLKRLGILNPEAFCELCGKEYCNKYFLRTHKWKRHGIFVPPDDLKDDQLALAQKMQFIPFMGMPGMPLNLMMANEKAVVAQRMLAAAAAASNEAASDETTHLAKRIKLEVNEDDTSRTHDERLEHKLQSNADNAEPIGRTASMPSTPEPAKSHADSLNAAANLPSSPEAAMGLQNLQKLQSMIQQLNDLNGKRPMTCHICGRELENQYALHAHIMTEHAGSMMDSTSMMPLNFQQHILQQQHQQQALKLSPTGSPGSLPFGNELRCNQCERDFVSLQEFKQHIAEVHLLTSSPLREGFVTPERPVNPTAAGANRPPYTITPTSSYCEICNKELCNKYFMKTHMQRMHGIEIENGAQIGGVVCNICNKELCSKYFLRVHKHNTHGIIEEGSPLPQPRQNGLSFEAQQQQQQLMENELGRGLNMSPFNASIAADGKSESADARYYANYTEVCPICTRRFRSAKWLRAHLLSDHGPTGIEKLREIEQQFGTLSKPSSPTLKIPNGSGSAGSGSNNSSNNSMTANPANLAQALQNLNAQHLLGNMPKNVLPGMFGVVAEQALQSPRFKEYQCSLCPFTTPYYAFLFIHERSHTILNSSGETATTTTTTAESALTATSNEHTIESSATKEEEIKVPTSSITTMQDKPQHLLPETHTTDTDTDTAAGIEPTNLSTRSSPKPATVSTITAALTATQTPQAFNTSSAVTPISYEFKEDFANLNTKEAIITTSNASAEIPKEKSHSKANSPITSSSPKNTLPQDILNELANKLGRTASYAIPKDINSTNSAVAEPHEMQAFIVEPTSQSDDSKATAADNCSRFVPAIIYLPVKERINEPISVTFNLTPA